MNIDLTLGAAIHLPDMVGKKAQASRALHIHMSIGDAKTMIHTRYKYIKLRTILHASTKGRVLTSQQVTAGDATIPPGNDKGVAFAVKLPTVSPDKWYALYEKVFADAPASPNPLTLAVDYFGSW